MDYNLDNRDDLLVRTVRTIGGQQVAEFWVYVAEGGTLLPPQKLAYSHIVDTLFDANFFEVLDVNGDGLEDWLCYGIDSGCYGTSNSTSAQLHVQRRDGKRPDMLIKIRNGLGSEIGVTYESAANRTVCDNGSEVYPALRIRSKLWLVSAHQEDNGIGGTNHYSYAYGQGFIDRRASAMLGFAVWTRVHAETGEKLVRNYDNGWKPYPGARQFHLAGVLAREQVTTPVENGRHRLKVTEHQNVMSDGTGGDTFFIICPETTEEETVETPSGLSMSVRRRVINRQFDGFGNVTEERAQWSDGYVEAQTVSFDNRTADWLIGLPTLVQTTHTAVSGASSTSRAGFTFDVRGALVMNVREPGVPAAGGGWLPLSPQADGIQTLYHGIEVDHTGQAVKEIWDGTWPPSDDARTETTWYDTAERMFPITCANSLLQTYTKSFHAALGLPTSSKDPNGLGHALKYDGFGRLVAYVEDRGGSLIISYPPAFSDGWPMSVRMDVLQGPTYISHCDSLGRVRVERSMERHDLKEVRNEIDYDWRGCVGRVARPHFSADPPSWSVYQYDRSGRIEFMMAPDGGITHWTYADVSNLPGPGPHPVLSIMVEDSLHRQRTITQDARGVPLKSTEPAGPTGFPVVFRDITFSVSPLNQIQSITDPIGGTTAFGYDRLGRVISSTRPDGGTSRTTYGVFGEVIQEEINSTAVSYAYDALGRLLNVTAPEGNTRFIWDVEPNGVGRLAKALSPWGIETAYAYDSVGRVKQAVWRIEGKEYPFEYGHDATGRTVAMRYPGPSANQRLAIDMVYGNQGQLVRVQDHRTAKLWWQWVDTDPSGRLSSLVLGNGVTSRMNESVSRPGRLGRVEIVDAAAKTLGSLDFQYDLKGNLTQRVDVSNGTHENFEYDLLDRLKNWRRQDNSGSRLTQYTYDASSNLRAIDSGSSRVDFSPDTGVGGPHAIVRSTSGDYTYDASGRQTSAPGRTVSYTTLQMPRVISDTQSGTSVTYSYDAFGSRVLERHSNGEEIVCLEDCFEFRQVNGGKQEIRCSIRAEGKPVVECRYSLGDPVGAPLECFYLHSDSVGSIWLVTDDQARVVDHFKYEPFGARYGLAKGSGFSSVSGTRRGFTGHLQDDSLGLVHTPLRDYDPAQARFLTLDPILGDATRQVALNPYAYCAWNPVTLHDPSGGQAEQPNLGDRVNGEPLHPPTLDPAWSLNQEGHWIWHGSEQTAFIGDRTESDMAATAFGTEMGSALKQGFFDFETRYRHIPGWKWGFGAGGVALLAGVFAIDGVAAGIGASLRTLGARMISAGGGAVAGGGALATPKIVVDWGSPQMNMMRMWHFLAHAEGLAPPNKSAFPLGTNILRIIATAERVAPWEQGNGNLARYVNVNGIGVVTVITDAAHRLVTLFPGFSFNP